MTRRPDSLLTPQRPGDEWPHDLWDDTEYTETAVVERSSRQHRVLKWLVFAVASVLIAGVLTGGAIGWWYIREVNPSGDPKASINFTVNDNDTLQTISVRLEEAGVITNAGVFRYYVEHKGGLVLTPGYYEFRPRDHIGNLMRVLNTPPAATYKRVTFPEGFTISQMGKRVQRDLPPMTAASFTVAATSPDLHSSFQAPGSTSLEGLLFPDTYQVAGNESETQVIARMIKLMERVGRQENIDQRATELGLDITPYKVLIVASLIEREAKFDSDRAKIARVIYNRLFLGMPLGIDAALYYGQPPDLPFGVLKATDSGYNTYLHPGLPPTPIANPGRASIRAALNPAPNPSLGDPLCKGLVGNPACVYLYYVVSDADGHHVFAVTLDQHNANVQAARDAGLLQQ